MAGVEDVLVDGAEDQLPARIYRPDASGALPVVAYLHRLVLLGDSAGGNLAAATSMVLRDEDGPEAAAQALRYPTLAPASTSQFVTRRELGWF